ncbi:phage integrase N-terminal SAM-like domain-containing protein [Catenovulum adriaticum]|uniref:Phage integrase N-terminal SAM-like domain-containing protein n=1 Tax=Catenovulum adriaticum TaxID=2984846 RepID=A0ABY7ATT8_9ALTE|nr:phage integrase N-terminal SAM-like domain-containing protein [Catenovulum sp. TS8]WAJ71935.1 phage integrase N-terminal SAM-like domain-containing protein [Catenovulum sp. TS8]
MLGQSQGLLVFGYSRVAYLHWVRTFIRFNDYKHPQDMGNAEIERFLNHLAVNRQVSG